MQVTLVSYFHNAEGYLKRYFRQVSGLQTLLERRDMTLSLVLGYGDCTDDTEDILSKEVKDFDAQLVDVSHGGKIYGSVVHSERFKQLASIGNKLWSHLPDDSGIVVLVESDLTWAPSSLTSLIEVVRDSVKGKSGPLILAPMVLTPEGRFYDTWAFRLNGRNFIAREPYHRDLRSDSSRFINMDSVGSVLVMSMELAEQLTWPEEDVIVGLCKQARELGATILLDTRTQVTHGE